MPVPGGRLAWDHHPGDDATVFLGEDLLAWLVLAIGAALAVGNALALIRPPETKRNDDDLAQAPKGRAIAYIVVGVIAAVWGLATLLA